MSVIVQRMCNSKVEGLVRGVRFESLRISIHDGTRRGDTSSFRNDYSLLEHIQRRLFNSETPLTDILEEVIHHGLLTLDAIAKMDEDREKKEAAA